MVLPVHRFLVQRERGIRCNPPFITHLPCLETSNATQEKNRRYPSVCSGNQLLRSCVVQISHVCPTVGSHWTDRSTLQVPAFPALCRQTNGLDKGATNIFSLLVPPQFDQYGYTFWVPSQVEPTCALIGSSLPALRHIVQPLAVHIQGSFTSWVSVFKSTTSTQSSALSTGSNGIAKTSAGAHHPFSRIEGSNISEHKISSTTRPDFELEELVSRERP
jgi:hypothetical protein